MLLDLFVAAAQHIDSILGGPTSSDDDRVSGRLRSVHLPNQHGFSAASAASRRSTGGSAATRKHCVAVARAFALSTLVRCVATYIVRKHVGDDVVVDAPTVPDFADDGFMAVDCATVGTLMRTVRVSACVCVGVSALGVVCRATVVSLVLHNAGTGQHRPHPRPHAAR
jgi:hypothetical protein